MMVARVQIFVGMMSDFFLWPKQKEGNMDVVKIYHQTFQVPKMEESSPI